MERLAELREQRALTLRELSAMSGVAADTINQIELGHRKPRPSTLRKLAKALGVEVADFFQEPKTPKALSAPKSPDDLRDFLEAQVGSSWLALPEDEWDNWWRGVSREEAIERYRQIRTEWRVLKQEWFATHGKVEAEPRLVPRGRQWGEVFYTLFSRSNLDAPAHAPKKGESEEDFQLRSSEGRASDLDYEDLRQQHKEGEHLLRALAEA